MRVFCGGLVHETNSFSPINTTLDDFAVRQVKLSDGKTVCEPVRDMSDELLLPPIARSMGLDTRVGFIASAEPSGPSDRDDYGLLRSSLLHSLEASLPVDAVALFLHGAQIAKHCNDCEGDILEQVRKIVGPAIPIGVMLDLHANVTKKMIANSDVLLCCKEYPHTDFRETAENLLVLLEETHNRRCRPCTAFYPVPVLGSFPTGAEPLKSLLEEIRSLESQEGVLAISIAHGFPWSDIDDAGASVIVITDDNKELAEKTAAHIGDRFFSIRTQAALHTATLDTAINAIDNERAAPIIIADVADNPGGGAPGDATFILRELIERKINNAALAMIYDPESVRLAMSAGEGNSITMRIGGRHGVYSGMPAEVCARVNCIREDVKQPTLPGFSPSPLGAAAAIQVDGIHIVVNSVRQQVFAPACFTELNIDPGAMDVLVVKSAHHFTDQFRSISTDIYYCAEQGAQSLDMNAIPYRHLQRPVWPLDPAPFTRDGKVWGDKE